MSKYKIGQKIRHKDIKGRIATVTKILKNGFEYKFDNPQSFIPRYQMQLSGGICWDNSGYDEFEPIVDDAVSIFGDNLNTLNGDAFGIIFDGTETLSSENNLKLIKINKISLHTKNINILKAILSSKFTLIAKTLNDFKRFDNCQIIPKSFKFLKHWADSEEYVSFEFIGNPLYTLEIGYIKNKDFV